MPEALSGTVETVTQVNCLVLTRREKFAAWWGEHTGKGTYVSPRLHDLSPETHIPIGKIDETNPDVAAILWEQLAQRQNGERIISIPAVFSPTGALSHVIWLRRYGNDEVKYE